MKTAGALILAAWLAACSTPNPPAPTWVPRIGERVATNFCSSCQDHIGKVQIVTVTAVKRDGHGHVTVFAKEMPDGVALEWVTKWQ